jgi:hypothetical protein
MLSPAARAALERAWAAGVAAEMERRRPGPAEDNGEPVLETLELMASRFRAVARPGDMELSAQLCALARARDYDRLDALRVRADLAPAETVALLIAGGDAVAARQTLRYYARHPHSDRAGAV